jgi:hypothetical protein
LGTVFCLPKVRLRLTPDAEFCVEVDLGCVEDLQMWENSVNDPLGRLFSLSGSRDAAKDAADAAAAGGGGEEGGAGVVRPFGGGASDDGNAVVGDLRNLQPGNKLEPSKEEAVRQMSDQTLLDSVRRPVDGFGKSLYRGSSIIANGNHRAAELLRRAADPASSITDLTKIPIQWFEQRQ